MLEFTDTAAFQATAFATVFLVVVGCVSAWFARRQVMTMIDPRLAVFAVRERSFVYIIVRNIGQSVAHGLQVDFDIGLTDCDGKSVDTDIFERGIPSLGPGIDYKFIWGSNPCDHRDVPAVKSRPVMVRATAYKKANGKGGNIETAAIIDLESFVHHNGQDESSYDLGPDIRRCARSLDVISRNPSAMRFG